MPPATLRLYFENPVGRLLEQPAGQYVVVQYHAGPRKLHELQAFLTHAGQLLSRQGWHKMLGDQRLLSPFTPEEVQWVTGFWLTSAQRRTDVLYGAVLLPHDVFARLVTSQVMNEAKAAAMTYRLFDEEAAAAAWLVQLG
jgi:hypothetical protein